MIEVTAQQMGFAEGCELMTKEEVRKLFPFRYCLSCGDSGISVVHGDRALGLIDGFVRVASRHSVMPGQQSKEWGIEFVDKIGSLSCLDVPGETHDLWTWKPLTKEGS
mgnify:CR=1 FL=1